MKKSTKLLSVILAIVMLFTSMSVMASAAKASYQSVSDLEGLQAYDDYGAVTRLSTEERVSILLDYLDNMLASLGGEPIDISVATIDYSSVNALLGSIDGLKGSIIGTLVGNNPDGGDLIARVTLDCWQEGMSRENTAQLTIVAEIVELLGSNGGAVQQLLNDGRIDLGALDPLIGAIVDFSAIDAYLADVPGLLKGLIYPLFERKDDDMDQINTLTNTGNTVDSVLTSFVQGLFTKPQSTTTVKADVSGEIQSDHTLPTVSNGLRYYYVAGTTAGQPSYTCYVYDTETEKYVAETEPFVLTEEVEGSGVYVFKKASGDTLKYYENGSYWLPSLVESGSAADIMNISTQTGVQMLYNMIPYVFGEMAPVVLNGSVKKAVAEWFGAQFNYVGEVGSSEVAALGDDVFFTQPQGDYLWEWSDYKVIDGVHYYRFEDSIYQADLSNKNAYMDIVNWDYVIPDDLLNDYIPGADGNTPSAAGYNTILQGLNDFLGEVIDLVLAPNVASAINWTDGSNSNLLENVKKAARAVVTIAPETIFGEHYADDEYYQLLIDESATDQEILCGIAAKLLEFLMPQLILPSASSLEGQSLGAMLAMVIRELATQLIPTYNYDDLIFTDYNTKTLRVKDNSYWLDVCLTMGVDIGMSYLRNLADLGEGEEGGYVFSDSKTYDYNTFIDNPQAWEATVDWVIDWALSDDYEWTWKMEKFVDCGETINLATAQDPWVKLGNILKNILPIDQILNVNTEEPDWLETALRDNFVLSLLNLDVGNIVGDGDTTGLLDIPNDSVLFMQPLLPAVVNVVRDLLNSLLYKVAGNDNLIPTDMVNGQIEQLFRSSTNAKQDNLANLARRLLEKINVAYNNGLLDPVMPILGFFVGWVTDAQKFADPTLTFTNEGGYSYIYTSSGTATTTLNITNNSAGMLLKHRNSSVTDQNYVMVIDGISGDFTTTQSFPVEVLPYSNASITLTAPYTEEKGVEINVHYHYKLKDGTELTPSLLMATTYQMVSNRTQSAFNGPYDDGFENGTWPNKVRLEGTGGPLNPLVTNRNTIAATIASIAIDFSSVGDRSGDISASEYRAFDSVYIEDTGSAAGYKGYEPTLNESFTVTPARLKADVDVEALPSGTIIDLGEVYANLHYSRWTGDNNAPLTANLGNLYFADLSEVTELFDAELSAARKAADYTADTWAVYAQAMKDTAAFVLAPIQMDGFAETYSDTNIQSVYDNLEAAVEQLQASDNASAAVTPASVLQPVLDTVEPEGQEINYQDYELYEYWDYEEQRTAARDLIAATTAPEAPDAYIEGNDLSEAEIDAIIDAETNSKLQSAIESTVVQPTEDDLAAYAEAFANWEPAAYTELELYDMASKLPYYKQFLLPKTTEKQFLAKELAYAAAQNYVETAWSTDSWGAYEAALEAANTVNSNGSAKQSEVFNAKYNLMLAQNNLVPAEDSARDTGVYDNLIGLIATADSIFADTEGAWTVKEDVEPAEAYKQLVEALGYEYKDADGYTQNLYWDSAKAFVATDRIKGDSTTAATNAMAAKLQAAIDNFVSAAQPELAVIGGTTGVIDTENKYVYGVTAGDAATLYFEALNGGTINMVANDAGATNGTGAQLQLLDAQGGVLDTYTLIIFGDVDGDSAVSVADSITIAQYVEGAVSALPSAVALFAADVDHDTSISVADVISVNQYVEGNRNAFSQVI